jgi:hypothetical protein
VAARFLGAAFRAGLSARAALFSVALRRPLPDGAGSSSSGRKPKGSGLGSGISGGGDLGLLRVRAGGVSIVAVEACPGDPPLDLRRIA